MALIELRGLTKIYRMGDSDVRALDGVDLTIEKGEYIAITGASGSGKSTLMHLIGCLDRPTAGTYLLNDRDVSRLSDRELATIRNKHIGFVFQTFNLINRTSAVENVGVPLFYARSGRTLAPARAALERVGLGKRYKHTPSELSGGERQRVAIARAIVNNPLVLLADEPTGNLDTRTGEQIMQIFHDLSEQGVTIILVTHEADVALQTERIVQMRDGQIISDEATGERRIRPGEHTARILDARQPAEAPNARIPEAVAADAPVEDATQGGPGRYAHLPPALAKGATTAFVLGLVAVLLFAGGIVAQAGISATGWKPDPTQRQQDVPPMVAILSIATLGGYIFGLVMGIIAICWSRGALRRIRTEPGNWVGAGRSRLGGVFGWLTILIPVLMIGLQFVISILRS